MSPSAFVLAPSSPTAHEICTYAAFQDGKKFHMKQKPASTDLDTTRIPWRGWLAHREMHPFARKAISRLTFGNLQFFFDVPDQMSLSKIIQYMGRLKSCPQVLSTMILLLLTTSASNCLKYSRNLGSHFLPSPVRRSRNLPHIAQVRLQPTTQIRQCN